MNIGSENLIPKVLNVDKISEVSYYKFDLKNSLSHPSTSNYRTTMNTKKELKAWMPYTVL